MPEPRTSRSDLLGALAAGFAVTAFCLILLWRDPLLFWNDDYQLSILPVFADVARSWSEGAWPLLSPYSWVCGNLAGEFQYGTFSIFVNAAVIAIWRFPLAFPQQAAALSITHLFVLAMGALLLARRRQLSIPLSIFVALVAALNGWIICWGATDWFGALAAFAWLPWAWWAMEKSLSYHGEASANRVAARIRAAVWPAPFVYLVVTGGFPYTIVMLALLIVCLSMRSVVETKSLATAFPMLIGVALGIGLSAPAWLALFDYVRGSARELQPSSAHWQWIVPWRALPGLVLPAWTVNWADFSTRMRPHGATELACGLVPVVALLRECLARIAGPASRVAARKSLGRIRWELALLVIVVVMSMVPTAGVFRWSFRWLPLVHLVLAICAAHLLQDRRANGAMAILLVGTVAIAMCAFQLTGPSGFPLIWIYLALAGLWFVAEWCLVEKLQDWIAPGVVFAALLATYHCIPPNCGVPKYDLAQTLLKPAPLDPARLYLSVYPPPEWNYRIENAHHQPIGQIVRPGSTSMWGGLRFINGYSPIRPAGIARELDSGIHGEVNVDMARALLEDRSGALEEIGIDGIIIARDVYVEPRPNEWREVFSNDEGRVFHRAGSPLDKVRSVEWLDSRPETGFSPALISNIQESRNKIEADVEVRDERPAMLKFTRPFFKGYVARLDGRTLPVGSYRGLLPVVEVPGLAKGHLILQYRPAWMVYGGAISIFCAIVVGAGGMFGALRRS